MLMRQWTLFDKRLARVRGSRRNVPGRPQPEARHYLAHSLPVPRRRLRRRRQRNGVAKPEAAFCTAPTMVTLSLSLSLVTKGASRYDVCIGGRGVMEKQT